MKKIIKILTASLLVACMLTCTFASTNALDSPGFTVSDSEPKLSNLSSKAHSFLYSFATVYVFTYENYKNIEKYFNEAQEFIGISENLKSDEVRQRIITNLSAELTDNLAISSDAINYLYDSVKNETNQDNYYSDELWNKFTNARSALAAELDNLTLDKHSNTLFFNLRNAFRDLCLSNNVMGDVNKDGKANVMDITYMQKSLAKTGAKLNSSQKLISNKWGHPNYFTITGITSWQKEFAGVIAETKCSFTYQTIFDSELAQNVLCDKMDYEFWYFKDIPVE